MMEVNGVPATTKTASWQPGSGSLRDPYVATLDVGSSSVRTMLFDGLAREVEGLGAQFAYEIWSKPRGAMEIDALGLADLASKALGVLHGQMQARSLRAAAVACCTFWHNVVGVGTDSAPVTPVLHPFDTRAADAAAELARRVDGPAQHARTGCVLHASYLPAKLLWLSTAQPRVFSSASKWMSFGEFLYLRLFGRAQASTSMVSGSGLWDQNSNEYEEEILSVLPIQKAQLALAGEMDRPSRGLRGEYRSLWPGFAEIPWFPAWGDGACSNIGSDCHSPDRFALMVGTSGAMRAIWETERVKIPADLWCYRVDWRRFILGGALSNGGEVFAWMKRVLALPDDEEIENQLRGMKPGSHGLTVLPLFAGERSPHWRGDARAVIAGLAAETQPVEILQGALESVALRFRLLYGIMTTYFGSPREVIASGGALLRSQAWTQMMAGALARPVTACLESEASSRGAALLALEQLGAIPHARDLPGRMGRIFEPGPGDGKIYEAQMERQEQLYARIFK